MSINTKTLERLQPRITAFIQARSEEGRLTTAEEVHAELLRLGILAEEIPFAELDASLRTILKRHENLPHEGLKQIKDEEGLSYYYHGPSMSEAYARLLLLQGRNPLLLMAAVVRDNSRNYPRPIRLNLFESLPFGLTQAEISSSLRKMADVEQYHDIQQTTTSIGTVFLYSAQFLEADYAAMLAEWLDVGQPNNP